MRTTFLRPMTTMVAFAVSLMLATSARAQDDGEGPPPDAEAASVDEFEPEHAEIHTRQAGEQGTYQRWVIPGGGVYYSPTLRGHFRAQWMFIWQNGRKVTFWGARIVHLDGGSPLRQLGLSPGDVVTRLDGIPVARGMFREAGGPWKIVEMEQHFGRTEVRYVIRGSNRVAIGDMMLDGVYPDGFDGSPIPP